MAGDQAPEQPSPLVTDPHPRHEPSRQQLGQGPGVEPVGLGLRGGDRPHGHGVGHQHPAHVGLEDPGDGESSSRGLQDHLILWPQALGEHLQVLGRRAHSGTGPARVALHHGHLAEVLVDVKSDEPHRALPSLDGWRPGGANDNYGCVLVAQPDQSQGRPITTAGSRPIVSRRPARPGSPEAPCPGARTLRESPSLVQAASPGFSCRYNRERPHRGLELDTPERKRDPAPGTGEKVRRRDRLGGLIHEYYRAAA